MRIFRFMSIAEFQNFLNGERIEGKFVKGKACFLEESIPAREKEPSIKSLTDLTCLKFKSTDFDGQMKELTELMSPMFINGDFEGQLKKIEHLTLADFMRKVRENATAEVLVEFETTEAFEQECDKVIMSYQQYFIEELQSNGYDMDTLHCVSYRIDLKNRFKNGIGVDSISKSMFEGVEHTLEEIKQAEQIQEGNMESFPNGKSGFADCINDDKTRLPSVESATRTTVGNVLENANIEDSKDGQNIEQE